MEHASAHAQQCWDLCLPVPYCGDLDGFPSLLYSNSLNLSLKLFQCVLILLSLDTMPPESLGDDLLAVKD